MDRFLDLGNYLNSSFFVRSKSFIQIRIGIKFVFRFPYF